MEAADDRDLGVPQGPGEVIGLQDQVAGTLDGGKKRQALAPEVFQVAPSGNPGLEHGQPDAVVSLRDRGPCCYLGSPGSSIIGPPQTASPACYGLPWRPGGFRSGGGRRHSRNRR